MNDKFSTASGGLIKVIVIICVILIVIALAIGAAYGGFLFGFSQCFGSSCSPISAQAFILAPLAVLVVAGYGFYLYGQRERNRKREVMRQEIYRQEGRQVVQIEQTILAILTERGDLTVAELSYLLEKEQTEVMDIIRPMIQRKLISQRIIDRQGYLHINKD